MKTCPNCKATGIPVDAHFCPMCGKQLSDGWYELVHHDDPDKYIWLTNYTDVYFDVIVKNTCTERFFPHTTIKLPWVKYRTIVAQSGGGAKTTKVMDDNTQNRLMLVFNGDKFVIIDDDNRQS